MPFTIQAYNDDFVMVYIEEMENYPGYWNYFVSSEELGEIDWLNVTRDEGNPQNIRLTVNSTDSERRGSVLAFARSEYEEIKDNLKKIHVEAVNLNNIDFKYTQVQKGVHQDFEIKKVKVRIDDVLIDSTSEQDSQRFYHTKMIDIEVPGFTYQTPDGFYKINFDKLKINSKKRNVLLTKVAYQPTLNKAAYYKKKGEGGRGGPYNSCRGVSVFFKVGQTVQTYSISVRSDPAASARSALFLFPPASGPLNSLTPHRGGGSTYMVDISGSRP